MGRAVRKSITQSILTIQRNQCISFFAVLQSSHKYHRESLRTAQPALDRLEPVSLILGLGDSVIGGSAIS